MPGDPLSHYRAAGPLDAFKQIAVPVFAGQHPLEQVVLRLKALQTRGVLGFHATPYSARQA